MAEPKPSALKVENLPADLIYTEADFADKLPSSKIGTPLPVPVDSQRLRGPNILQWMTFVETTLQARLLFKHCTHPPIPKMSPYFSAWQVEEHFIRSWLLNQTLHPEIYSKFRNRLTVKAFWDQAHSFGGSDQNNWRLFRISTSLSKIVQGTMSIADYAMAHREKWDDIDYYAPGEGTDNADRRVTVQLRLMGFLAGLNPAYDAISSQALKRAEGLPDFDSLVQELTEAESHSQFRSPLRGSYIGLLCSSHPTVYDSHWTGTGEGTSERLNRESRGPPKKREPKEVKDKALIAETSSPGSTSVDQLAEVARLTAMVSAMQSQSTASFGNRFVSYTKHVEVGQFLRAEADFGYPPDGMFLSTRWGGLLRLDGIEICCCWTVGAVRVDDTASSSDAAEQRRGRLHLAHQPGHPPFLILQCLFPDLCKGLDPKMFVCDSCQLAKHRRASFSPSTSHTTVPLYRIHSDVWGPAPQTGLKGHRWFLIFVDEATRYTWTYLLVAKSAVAATVQQFVAMIKTQFGRQIQRFRSDNARDFFNIELDSFFASQGILHESSCVATPEQNGIAERRIGYVTSTARTLLLNYNVPWSYWSEATLTASHLVNRLPSSSIEFGIPIDRMEAAFRA
ncbi:uncharacterized protein LOC144707896 [Wolffia australiana]